MPHFSPSGAVSPDLGARMAKAVGHAVVAPLKVRLPYDPRARSTLLTSHNFSRSLRLLTPPASAPTSRLDRSLAVLASLV